MGVSQGRLAAFAALEMVTRSDFKCGRSLKEVPKFFEVGASQGPARRVIGQPVRKMKEREYCDE